MKHLGLALLLVVIAPGAAPVAARVQPPHVVFKLSNAAEAVGPVEEQGPGTPAQEPQERAVFGGHAKVVSRVAVTADGKILATGSYDRTVKLGDLATGQEMEGGPTRVKFRDEPGFRKPDDSGNNVRQLTE